VRDGLDLRDRVALGLRSAWLRQAGWTDLGGVARFDGILVTLTGLPEPTLNAGFVESPPADPGAALRAAEAWFEANGQRVGLDLERGRHPAVERAAARLGLSPAVARPGMARAIPRASAAPSPPGVSIRAVRDGTDLDAVRTIQREVFGLLPEVATGFLPPVAVRTPGFRLLLATLDGEPAGSAGVHLDHGAAGIMGVATRPAARRRGIGTALTIGCLARAADEGCDLAWLQSEPAARTIYDRLRFEVVSDWVVWTR
jgi:ribosomal protein S18 acetylase RimI-like enzyme